MTTLISPANNRPCEFVVARDGFVCLRQDYVTPQVRWFTLAAIERVNPVATCALPTPLIVNVLPEMVGAISHAIGVTLVYPPPPDDAYVIQPVEIVVRERVSLWHTAMKDVA